MGRMQNNTQNFATPEVDAGAKKEAEDNDIDLENETKKKKLVNEHLEKTKSLMIGSIVLMLL